MTFEAADYLSRELAKMVAPRDMAFRVLRELGGFGIQISAAQPDDIVVRHRGRAVLFVGPTIAAALGDRQVDVAPGASALTLE